MPVPAQPVDEAALLVAAATVITALAGPDARVRDDQLDAARVLVVEGRRALVVQATGWGKSAVYWIAARAVRDAGRGPVLVVSPLLSLMRDQVTAAARAGLTAVTLNSANITDWAETERAILADQIDVLLVSPERLANPAFERTVLADLLPRLGLLVIDEAHCISSWGHDFRPDYQRIARLLVANPDLPVLATTATANARVTADVAVQLGADTFVQRGQLARASLHLSVLPGLSPIERYAWIDEALGTLPGSGIVYVLTVAEANRLSGFLQSRGHIVPAYTGQTDPDQRTRIEDDLRANRLKAVVATSALGMGYDKPDLAFCLHVGSPGSPVDYYQQVGRAGRALESAVVTLLPAANDERIWEWFATASVPKEGEAALVLSELQGAGSPLSVQAIEGATGVRRSRVDLLLKILAVDGSATRTVEGWSATGLPWTYDRARYAELIAARRGESALMRSYAHQDTCLETLLRRALDDDVVQSVQCGRCSWCTGQLPGGLPSAPAEACVLAATSYLRGIDVVLEPRKMWAGGLVGRKGRIAHDVAAERGRALAFADDPAWSDVGGLVADGSPDRPIPASVLDGLIATLTRWSATWGDRPTIVVPMPSSSHPEVIGSLAARLAAVGRLEVVDILEQRGPKPTPDTSPAARARALQERLCLAEGAHLPSVPVLLVDDFYRTGWTMTLAAALLREAGASAVLPMVIHQRP